MRVACTEASFSQSEGELFYRVRECSSVSLAGEPHMLRSDEIDVWRGTLSATQLDELPSHDLLSEDETARITRFHFHKDRQDFLFCRSMLRILLASYLGSPPA